MALILFHIPEENWPHGISEKNPLNLKTSTVPSLLKFVVDILVTAWLTGETGLFKGQGIWIPEVLITSKAVYIMLRRRSPKVFRFIELSQ